MRQYLLNLLYEEQQKRNWNMLPDSFQIEKIRWLKEQIRPHFRGRGNELIKARVALASADDFPSIEKAINLLPE